MALAISGCEPGQVPDDSVLEALACLNGTKDPSETDVDCGGPCAPCVIGKTCILPTDCASGYCRIRNGGAVQCVPAPSCYDGEVTAPESDRDCGGGVCDPCDLGQTCTTDTDCLSGTCRPDPLNTMRCVVNEHCRDGTKSGNETGVDCGGDNACARCPVGDTCNIAADCDSGHCVADGNDAMRCRADATCPDGVKNGDESGIDCGGSGTCPRCTGGETCRTGADCESTLCAPDGQGQDRCSLEPGCEDNVRNGGETGVDCGGRSPCPRCPDGQRCVSHSDCAGNVCVDDGQGGRVCKSPRCDDLEKNGEETDIDCGGPTCAPCVITKSCLLPRDCEGLLNAPPNCTDNICIKACEENYADCAAEPLGCETNISNDSRHCGGCDKFCPGPCVGGVCRTVRGWASAEQRTSCFVRGDNVLMCAGTHTNNLTLLGFSTGVVTTYQATSLSGPSLILPDSGHISQTMCAIVGGGVRCWGANPFGQRGDGLTTFTQDPTDVLTAAAGNPPLASITQLTMAPDYGCGRDIDGRVFCWGKNTVGQLGDGTTTTRSHAAQVVGLPQASQVAAAANTACAIVTGGKVMCWGAKDAGALGSASPSTTTPVSTDPLGHPATQISAGIATFCVRLSNGTVSCWGNGSNGMRGMGGQTWSPAVPSVIPGLTDVTKVSVGWGFVCALISNGAVKCWGSNVWGTLGLGTANSNLYDSPTLVPGLSDVEDLFCSSARTCIIRDGGTDLRCWGHNELNSPLGLGPAYVNQPSVKSPTSVPW